MHENHAMIVTASPEPCRHTRDLERCLQQDYGFEVGLTADSTALAARLAAGPASRVAGYGARLLVFVDLRCDAAWSKVSELGPGADRARRAVLIGLIVDDDDLERRAASLTELDGVLKLPVDHAQLGQLLKTFRPTPAAPPQPRVVEGTTRRFVTYTPSLFPMLDELETAARHDVTILLVGESGTGKSFLARLIHELSPRREGKFLTVACGALPSDLIGSELFGHVKGAFTGADREKQGKFEAAAGGSMLLDEIDVLGLESQASLLRVVETGEYEPVGSNETRHADCRLIVATNLDLPSLIVQHRFRRDLYFRLKQVKFVAPPLRERPDDIVPLARGVIEAFSREQGLPVREIHPETAEILKHYSWPGNIRELRNEVQRAALFCRNAQLTPELLSSALVNEARQRKDEAHQRPAPSGLAREVAQTERDVIEQMLRTYKLNRSATARALGISRVTLYNKMRKYRIRTESSDDEETTDARPV